MIGYFVYHRDLRVHDNIGLRKACAECDIVYCFFIFDPRQVSDKKNPYFSANSFSFMLDCLRELSVKIPLHFIYAKQTPAKALRAIIGPNTNYTIYSNADYTPFAIARDVEFYNEFKTAYQIVFGDLGFNSPLDIKPYKVYTPYYNVAAQHAPQKPFRLTDMQRKKIKKLNTSRKIPDEILAMSYESSKILHYRDLTRLLRRISGWRVNEYSKNRDDLNFETSRLSPYMKYGVISVRQAYQLCADKTFRKQLYWRDFYTQIVYHFPNTMADYDIKKSGFELQTIGDKFESNNVNEPRNVNVNESNNVNEPQNVNVNNFIPIFESKPHTQSINYAHSKNFRDVKNANKLWRVNEKLFTMWCEGRTDVHIVDACMRQLNETGFMHNRGRLIVSSFLTKILHIDWRRGEQYFATKLTDYDPALNNGNWQWSAGTGADAQPFFRIFNPYTQGKNHDPQAEYIKRYVPELAAMDARDIHSARSKIIDYEKERAVALKLYGI